MENVSIATSLALCCGCGACSSVCKANAVQMTQNTANYIVPIINENLCTNCGLCLKVCPGINCETVDASSYDVFKGPIIASFIGHATDSSIRIKSQSGGVATALLKYMLESSKIDFAVVNEFNENSQYNQAVRVYKSDDIMKSLGSYYCQSSVVNTAISNTADKYAVVTLGCQSQAFERIRKNALKLKCPEYNIGLFCGGNYSTAYIKAIANKIGMTSSEHIRLFRFRDKQHGGWPGNIHISTDKKNYCADKNFRIQLKAAYKCFRCELCHDQLNTFSDIAVGDPWGLKDIGRENRKKGVSVIIVRTEKGLELLKAAEATGCIRMQSVDQKEIVRGQTVDSRLKITYINNLNTCKNLGFAVPEPVIENIPGIEEQNKLSKFKRNEKHLLRIRNITLSSSIDEITRIRKVLERKGVFSQTISLSFGILKKFARKIINCFRGKR